MSVLSQATRGRRRAARAAVALCAVLLVTSCSSDSGGDEGDVPKSGGTLTMATWSPTQSLDPIQVAGTGNSAGAELAAIYDTIMTYDQKTGEFHPNTAESLESNEDFTEWTLRLKPDITFSDGSAYDSAAVVASMKRHTEAHSSASSLLAAVKDYATPDDLTVVFTLAFPWNKFPYALASTPGMIVNPAAVEKQGEDFGIDPQGAGAGPFVLDSFRPGESVDLVRNTTYWGGDVPLEKVRFISAGDGPSTLEAFKAGTVQVAFLRDAAAIADAEAEDIDRVEVPYSANDTLIMNNGLPVVCQGGEPAEYCKGKEDGATVESDTPTADVRVRQAVAAAIDLQTLNDRVYSGEATMTTALLSEESRWYTGVEGPSYDPERAKELVAEAKADGWDGSIRVSCHTGLPTWGPAVSGMLEAVGFDVDLTDQQEIAANTGAVVVQRNFDIACFGASISDGEPFFAINRDFNSSYVATGGGNFAGYVNPEVDAAIARGRSATDDDTVAEALGEVAAAYAEDVPFLALTAQPEVVLVDDSVDGVAVSANTIVLLGGASLR